MSAGAPHDDRYRTTSLWLDQLDEPLTPRPALPGDRDADVAIVGAGYTGLWTAYHLLKSDPGLRVVLLEAEIAGFGASGRNGGWCSAIFPASFAKVARLSGRDAAVRLQRTLNALVPDIGRVAADEGIDCRFVQGGYLSAARNPAQVQHARDEVATWREWGFGEDDLALLDAAMASGERVLVFSQYVEMLDILAKIVRGSLGVEPFLLHGGMSKAKRDEAVDRFQSGSGPGVFLVSLKAGGVGLNLTAATRVIHYDLWFNPAVESQATDRAFRIGQTRDVFVHRLVTKGTLE